MIAYVAIALVAGYHVMPRHPWLGVAVVAVGLSVTAVYLLLAWPRDD